ncbi:MAG: hypothetical protein KDA29_14505 [Phycisphaerales bacterium]|nr:hypothetical protein [Phycisphaerales bacterium]
MTRIELMRWLWPHCDHGDLAVMFAGTDGKLRPGWISDDADAMRAVKAFTEGKLGNERFESENQRGVSYSITGAERLGFVLHRDGQVGVICIDLDDHTGDGGNVNQLDTLKRFFGAEPVVFSSKGGRGLHAFYKLQDAMPVEGFVAWSKAWGFNRENQPELFPKTGKLTQVWMPGEPNADGGDTYQSGTIESALITSLPNLPPINVTEKTLRFLRGEVTQPGRNDALNTAAFELGQKMVERSAAWALCERGARVCGLEPSETERTFDSGYSSGLRSPPSREAGADRRRGDGAYELTAMGNSKRFVSMSGREAKFCTVINRWYVWDTNRWVCDGIRAEALAKLSVEEITDAKHRKYSCGKRGIEEILFLSRSEPSMAVTPSDFDADPMLFNCQSGTIDLKSGTQQPHERSQLLSRISPVGYAPQGSCPQWSRFLETVFGGDNELIGYIQRVCGYVLTGQVSEQVLFFMYGDGCNGKSVFASVLQHILGDYARKVPAQILSRSDRVAGEGPSPFLSTLIGARLAASSELEEGQKFAEAKIKDMTGGDHLTSRGLRQDPVEFDPMFKLLVYGNHKPQISGVDHGIWRRIHLIPFLVRIPESKRDPRLIDKLKGESGAILAWMVRGCLQWQQRGLCPPDAVTHATTAYRSESDTVGRFIEECCTRADGVFVQKGELHEAFEAWCKSSGECALEKNTFGKRVKRLGFEENRLHGGRVWLGLELSDTEGGGDA